MAAKTFSDMNFQLKLLLIITGSLALLLLLLWLVDFLLMPRLRKNGTAGESRLLGRPARVTKAIQPGRPGQVLCRTADGRSYKLPARAQSSLPAGAKALVVQVQQDGVLVRPAFEDVSSGPGKARREEPA